MNNTFLEVNLSRDDDHARLWYGPYGWQIYPAGEMNQIRFTKQNGYYINHETVIEAVNLLKYRGTNKPVLLDCGSNIGNMTMGVRHYMGENVEIHAFEAQKTIAQMLTGSIALMSWNNVTVHNVAITDGLIKEIEVPLYDYSKDGQFGSIELGKETPFRNADMAKGIAQEIAGYTVIEGRSIDSYGFKQVDYLKLDIEGMEITALKGASDTIDRCRPVMHIEHYKANQEELKEYIYSKNYHIVDEDAWYDYTCIPKT